MPPPFTSYTPAAGWEKAADHPIGWKVDTYGQPRNNPGGGSRKEALRRVQSATQNSRIGGTRPFTFRVVSVMGMWTKPLARRTLRVYKSDTPVES